VKKRNNHLVVVSQMPLPARRLLNVVQQMLRIGPLVARRTIQAGQVLVNERPRLSPDSVLHVGDQVDIVRDEGRTPRLAAGREQPRIVFQDEHLLIVEKPAGLLTVPTPRREKVTLISELRRMRLRKEHREGRRQRGPADGGGEPAGRAAAEEGDFYCVHRLDRDVSGLLVFARSLAIAEQLRDQFAARKPLRSYEAIVAGELREAEGTFTNYLATDKHLNRYAVETADEGELAITHYQVTQRLADTTLVAIRLETGRRNQIRVHFAEVGHPVLGDSRYRRRTAAHPQWPYDRLALHAEQLGFTHPVTGQPLEFKSDRPEVMQAFLDGAESGW
jgi:23S rRNA pseudouridine1911/1915/1917 synthase